MIQIRLPRIVLCFDFSFFAVLALFFYFNSGNGISAFLSCLFHELGHLAVMLFNGVRADKMYFYGGGIKISADIECLPFTARLAVLSAGCAFNGLLALFGWATGMYTLAYINILTGLLNLLPLYPLDGAQLAQTVMHRYLPPQRAERAVRIIRFAVLGMVLCAVVVLHILPNVTLIAFGLYVFFTERQDK